MDRAGKDEILGQIKEAFADVQSIVLADYRGITVPVVTEMRDEFRKAGCHYRVLKNSLVKIAVKGSAMEPMTALLAGNRRYHRNRRRVGAMLAALGFAADQPFQAVEHHLAHASSACHLSGYTTGSAVLGIDGRGEYATTFFGYCDQAGVIHRIICTSETIDLLVDVSNKNSP